jgi:hypothetical protein
LRLESPPLSLKLLATLRMENKNKRNLLWNSCIVPRELQAIYGLRKGPQGEIRIRLPMGRISRAPPWAHNPGPLTMSDSTIGTLLQLPILIPKLRLGSLYYMLGHLPV